MIGWYNPQLVPWSKSGSAWCISIILAWPDSDKRGRQECKSNISPSIFFFCAKAFKEILCDFNFNAINCKGASTR